MLWSQKIELKFNMNFSLSTEYWNYFFFTQMSSGKDIGRTRTIREYQLTYLLSFLQFCPPTWVVCTLRETFTCRQNHSTRRNNATCWIHGAEGACDKYLRIQRPTPEETAYLKAGQLSSRQNWPYSSGNTWWHHAKNVYKIGISYSYQQANRLPHVL